MHQTTAAAGTEPTSASALTAAVAAADSSFENSAFSAETPATVKDDVTVGSRDSLEELQMIVGDTTSISATTDPDHDVSCTP